MPKCALYTLHYPKLGCVSSKIKKIQWDMQFTKTRVTDL